jgi:hypothetical protein
MSNDPDFVFVFNPERRKSFRNGVLGAEWANRYPDLFDDDDVRILTTEHQRKYHFFEWLSSVLLYESTGFVSLLEKYSSKRHDRKLRLFSKFVPSEVFDFLINAPSGHPDLFCFHPQTGEWFFSEVKGAQDILRENQISMHEQLKMMTGKKVRIIQLNEVKP